MADKIDYIKVIKDVFKKEIKEGDEETKLIVDLVKKLADINTIKYTKQAINQDYPKEQGINIQEIILNPNRLNPPNHLNPKEQTKLYRIKLRQHIIVLKKNIIKASNTL